MHNGRSVHSGRTVTGDLPSQGAITQIIMPRQASEFLKIQSKSILLHSRNNGPLLQAKVTNNRFKSYVALRFTGLDAKKVRKEDITKEDGTQFEASQRQTSSIK